MFAKQFPKICEGSGSGGSGSAAVSPEAEAEPLKNAKLPDPWSEYVGSTSRTLNQRISEHKGRSVRTGAWLAKPPQSAIREHAEQCSYPIPASDFSILSQCNRSKNALRILESLYIYNVHPSLNDKKSAYPLKLYQLYSKVIFNC